MHEEGATFEQDCPRIAHLGLTLAEAQQLLKPLQDHMSALSVEPCNGRR
jgi:hypothetical protein